MYRFWNKFNGDKRVDYTVIETNFVPTLMSDEAFRDRAEAYGTQIVDHKTVGRGKKRGSIHDEEYGIAALASLFSTGNIAFANAGIGDRQRLQPLIDDMLSFPWASEKDALVALWVANGEAAIPHHPQIDPATQAANRGAPPIVQQRSAMMRRRRG